MKELVEVKCANCSKEIYVQKECTKQKMFCTLGCMDSYMKETFNRQQS
jgi:hypothetical protein